MLLDELRARIAQIHREHAERSDHRSTRVPATGVPAPVSPREINGESCQTAAGTFWLVRRTVPAFRNRKLDLEPNPTVHASTSAELELLAKSFPDRTLFLDLETCGFSGSPLFLIGLLRHVEGQPVVEQLLARTYAEEPAVLSRLWQLATQYDVLVTFNGKTFDWPVVVERSTVHRLKSSVVEVRYARHGARLKSRPAGRGSTAAHELVHCDLLHLARRHWRKPLDLPNCRLQTLETLLCQRYRSGDIPGWAIPAAYHDFVRTGNATQIEQVLEHNALDLITLAELTERLLGSRQNPTADCMAV